MPLGYPVANFSPADSDPCFCGSGRRFGDCCGARTGRRGPPAGIRVFQRFVEPDLCRKWVERLERRPRKRARILDPEQSSPGAPVYVEDPSRVCDDVNPGVLRKAINDTITRGFQHVASSMGESLAWYEVPRILRYEAGGRYLRHADSCQYEPATRTWYRVEDRDLSLLLYLNEDYTGGGLTFTHFHCHFRPRTGDLLVFPSDNRYEHQAEPVESGVRYAVASWAFFRSSRRVRERAPNGAIPFRSSS
ncbi:2OG-Fe(II) oxygenase [Elongatibacter sediminis]|uniref:2OG-Fe(II) oxygenase n=1 Tax=Elongatibacter sediminis TaxID=3119006 RepID=A0AAW9R6Y3_9GAMM